MQAGPSPRTVVRRALAADAGALAELAERTFRDTYAAATPVQEFESYVGTSFGPGKQRLEIESADIVTLIAERGGQALGYAQLRRGEAPACVGAGAAVELWRLYVDRPAIGHGVGRELLDAARSEARKLQAHALWLGVWERNARAIAFYRKCGFRQAGAHVFHLGAEAQTDLILVADLTAAP